MILSETCNKHRCFKERDCRYKTWLSYLTPCRIGDKKCSYCSPNIYSHYEPEVILLP